MAYDASSIQALEGLEAVRTRPGMYIGDTGIGGLHHLIWEILDNSVDEALGGHATTILVDVNEDSCCVEDDGRGIPFGKHPKTGRPAAELVFTTLHAGGKFGGDAYKSAGGLHGVGSSVVNALSSSLDVCIWRDGKEFNQSFIGAKPRRPSTKKAPRNKHGTRVSFAPDPEIFGNHKFELERVRERVTTKAYLTPGVSFMLNGEVLCFDGGLDDLVTAELKAKELGDILDSRFVFKNADVQVALTWTESPLDMDKLSSSFANGIPTRDGGTHLKGLRSAVVEAVRDYSKANKLFPRRPEVTPDDIREGCLACIHAFVGDPQFQGQTKDRLNNPEVRGEILRTVRPALDSWLASTTAGKHLAQRAVDAARARTAARAAAQQVKRKSATSRLRLPGKLADCSSTDPGECELFIVEGDSAGGSAKQGRNRQYQAVLPLRGKVLNAIMAGTKKAADNKELSNVLTALGTGHGAGFDISKLRYDKIILLMDADVDGHHIATLMLGFFYTVLPQLILDGKVYIAQPPLFRVRAGTQDFWAKDEMEKEAFLSGLGKRSRANAEVSRFKGLGEMMPKMLFETTMDPSTRSLLQVSIADGDELVTAAMLHDLMGADAGMRAQMVMNYAENAEVSV